MTLRTETVEVTITTPGYGTAFTHPISGEIRQVLMGTILGTAHVTLAPISHDGFSGTTGIFHGAGTVLLGAGAQGPYSKYKSFPVVGGDTLRVVVSAPGAAALYTKKGKVKIVYQDR